MMLIWVEMIPAAFDIQPNLTLSPTDYSSSIYLAQKINNFLMFCFSLKLESIKF